MLILMKSPNQNGKIFVKNDNDEEINFPRSFIALSFKVSTIFLFLSQEFRFHLVWYDEAFMGHFRA